MEQVVSGHYQQIPELGLEESPAYSRLSINQSIGREIELERVTLQTPRNHVVKRIPPKPVYVSKDANELVYNSGMMERGREYRVDWDGERFMLIRKEDGVEIHRLEEDGD